MRQDTEMKTNTGLAWVDFNEATLKQRLKRNEGVKCAVSKDRAEIRANIKAMLQGCADICSQEHRISVAGMGRHGGK